MFLIKRPFFRRQSIRRALNNAMAKPKKKSSAKKSAARKPRPARKVHAKKARMVKAARRPKTARRSPKSRRQTTESPAVLLGLNHREKRLDPFIRKQKEKLLQLRDAMVDSMAGVAQGTLRSRAEGSEASAFGMHQADAGSDAYDRDFALSLLSQEQDALYEIDEALKRPGNKPLRFKDTFSKHFWITTSGHFSTPALMCAMLEMGIDRILFSVDWPYVENEPGMKWMETVPLSTEDKAKMFHKNARKLLKL